MKARYLHRVLVWILAALAAGQLHDSRAEIRLPSVIADNMVLQRDQSNPIWGWENPGTGVVVAIGRHSASATAGPDGRWQVSLPGIPARSEPMEMHIRSSTGSERTIRNVLVGEVWLFTGPSNIYWPVERCDNAATEIAAADYPQIRFFTVAKHAADEAQEDCSGNWTACSPKTVGAASGIAYFFSRRIHEDMNVPIGVMQSFWGGTRVEAWTSLRALRKQPELASILEWWQEAMAENFDAGKAEAEYRDRLREWERLATEAKREGRRPPAKPKKAQDAKRSMHRPGCLFNGMIAPLIPYGIQGVVSYQGLGNLYWAEYSRPLMTAMIRDWRARWGQGPFPFGMVQPAPFPCEGWPMQREDAYSLQRESQLLALDEIPNTGIATTMDIGDLDEIHFTNKQEVGRRMALWALAEVYRQPAAYAAPRYESMTVEGNRIRIHFVHAGKGLVTSDGNPPTHFVIAGKDGRFEPAKAVIDGETVLVHNPRISDPRAVRFAWSDTAVPNLFNGEGLPVSIFRTDVPTRIVIAIAEPGYHTERTLPALAGKIWTGPRGYEATVIQGDPAKHDLAGLEVALPGADVLVLSIRRQALPEAQLRAIRDHLAAGKPLLAIRTSSHGLTAKGKGPAGNPEWDAFDTEVLGAGYKTHAGHDLAATFTAARGAADHPILEGVELPFSSGGGIYFSTAFADTTRPLLIGTLEGHDPEPVAWTNIYGKAKAKIFYTSLGQEEEFASPSFQKLLGNAMEWLRE